MIFEKLIIENFKILKNVEFSHLGRVNLIVGKNNSGKSTVLDALRVYAQARESETIFLKILIERDDILNLNIIVNHFKNTQNESIKINDIEFNENYKKEIEYEKIPFFYIPTTIIESSLLRDLWDNISATSYSYKIIEALKIISPEIEALAFRKIADKEVPFVNIGNDVLIPLKKSGEGLLRILQLALGVVNAKKGLFLLDEFENGLHYSVQAKVWKAIIELAIKLDVQIFATTHSWDCIKSLQQCTEELSEDVEIFLFRLGKSMRVRDKGEIMVTEYDCQALAKITQAEFEIR